MKTILDYIIENNKDSHISFSAPGHKGRKEIFDRTGYGEFCRSALSLDIAPMQKSDGSRRIKEIAATTEENYADLYGVRATRILPDGVGSGIAAAILACVPDGGKLILGRNQVQAVFDALRLGDIEPYYLTPEINKKTGLCDGISASIVRKACKANPDASAVLITSPTYYGAMSDIAVIAEVVHKFDKILIVDQTYGAHLKFFDAINETCTSAEDAGADIVINGIGQNLLSYSGAAIINICSDRVDPAKIVAELYASRETMSSISLAGIDINEKIIRKYGGDIISGWVDDLRYAYRKLRAISGLDILTGKNHDATKIAISLARFGIGSEQLANELRQANIVIDRVFGDYVLLQTGAGNTRSDYKQLVDTVKHLAELYGVADEDSTIEIEKPDFRLKYGYIPRTRIHVPLYQADGRILNSSIIAYPPAVPIACPGEILTMEVISYISRALDRGVQVDGVDEEGYIYVG